MDAEAFGALIEARLADEAEFTVVGRTGLGVDLDIDSVPIRINLDNYFRVYRQHPDQLIAVSNALVQAVRAHYEARLITSFEQVQARVFPMLKPIALLNEVQERKLPMLAYRPFIADLIIAYVIDEPGSVAYINEDHLERWGIADHELHARAMVNLTERTAEQSDYTSTGVGPQRIVVYHTQDGFDATRLLLPTMLEQWRAQFPGNMVIGIPNRDFLIAFSDSDRSVIANVAAQIQADALQREHGLTDQLFTLTNGEIRVYQWEGACRLRRFCFSHCVSALQAICSGVIAHQSIYSGCAPALSARSLCPCCRGYIASTSPTVSRACAPSLASRYPPGCCSPPAGSIPCQRCWSFFFTRRAGGFRAIGLACGPFWFFCSTICLSRRSACAAAHGSFAGQPYHGICRACCGARGWQRWCRWLCYMGSGMSIATRGRVCYWRYCQRRWCGACGFTGC
ncbi:DUF1444 family protein [Candidatus Gracilibacteria bacterium]|nr:DUF1444 family protein [Candidatus Gracilibacteria bacterium]